RRVRVELGAVRVGQPGQVTGHLDDHALQAKAQAQDRDAVLARVPDRADLPLDAAHAETARDQHPVHSVEFGGGAFWVLAGVADYPADVHLSVVGETAGLERLGRGQIRI